MVCPDFQYPDCDCLDHHTFHTCSIHVHSSFSDAYHYDVMAFRLDRTGFDNQQGCYRPVQTPDRQNSQYEALRCLQLASCLLDHYCCAYEQHTKTKAQLQTVCSSAGAMACHQCSCCAHPDSCTKCTAHCQPRNSSVMCMSPLRLQVPCTISSHNQYL